MALSAAPGGAPTCAETDSWPLRTLIWAGPRCATYPGTERFDPAFGYRDFLQAVAGRRTRGSLKPLSLYLHIPFCDAACHYCGSDKGGGRSRAKAITYLAYLKREIEMLGMLFGGMNQLAQLHLAGGAPAYLSDIQLGELMSQLRRWFQFAPDQAGEYSIDIDGAALTRERVFSLRRQGFNRINLGLQDGAAQAQPGAGPGAPREQTRQLVEAARAAKFKSVCIDLVYGLPGPDPSGVAHALDTVVMADPDRIAVYDYAHLPALSPAQRGSTGDAAHGGGAMLALCIGRLTGAGYVQVGMDHFAKPLDDLVVAERQGRLHRNFQGYSSHGGVDLLACGVAASGTMAATCSQNAATLEAYYESIDKNELPIARGIKLSMDDALRRSIIQMLICNFELSIASIELAYPIAFAQYFAPEIGQLEAFARDGWLTLEPEWLSVNAQGRPFIRAICALFERQGGRAAHAPIAGGGP